MPMLKTSFIDGRLASFGAGASAVTVDAAGWSSDSLTSFFEKVRFSKPGFAAFSASFLALAAFCFASSAFICFDRTAPKSPVSERSFSRE